MLWVAIVLAIGAAALVGWITRDGIGVSPDSRLYLLAAGHLREGYGLMMLTGEGARTPFTHYAPLYPITLATLTLVTGNSMYSDARIFNMWLIAATVVLMWLTIRRITQTRILPILGALLTVVAIDVLQIHVMVWSEPMFVFCSLLGLLLLGMYLETPRRSLLLASSAACATAFLSRYSGAALILAAVWVLLRERGRPLPRRFADALMFSAITIIGIVVWTIRNHVETGNLADRTLLFHPPKGSDWKIAFRTLATWTVPQGRVDWQLVAGAILTIAILLGAGVCEAIARSRLKRRGNNSVRPGHGLRHALWWFAVIYLVFLILSISLFDAYTHMDGRILAPAHIAFIPAVIGSFATMYRAKLSRRVAPVAVGLLVLLVIGQCVQATAWSTEAPDKYLDLTNRSWKNSDLIAFSAKVPKNAQIYSNGVALMYFRADRFAMPIPKLRNPGTLVDDPRFARRTELMRDSLSTGKAYIFYFKTLPQGYLPPRKELQRQLNLKLIYTGKDGYVYKGRPKPATQPTSKP